jgi:hypothetical protein
VHDNVVTALYRVQTSIKSSELVTFYVPNTIGAKVGDRVEFELPTNKVFFVSPIPECVSLLCLLFIGSALRISFFAILIAWIFVIMIIKRIKSRDDDKPRIVQIIDNPRSPVSHRV